ncbi:MAG TPA: fibronectin type III domain-containing protein [Holophagaceae bacterium]|nr:fibronectin type III domain-containing protein [Holophagaceae bacterium]
MSYSHPYRWRAPLASGGLILFALACGGGSSPRTSAGSAPTPTPTAPAAPALQEPFWSTESPERPHRARPLAAPSEGTAVIQLSAAERTRLREAAPAEMVRPASGESAGLAVPTRIVTGVRSYTFRQDTGTTLQPFDLTAAVIQALVPNSSGGLDTLVGVGHSDGTFSISGVPVGGYWLRFGTTYLWTTEDHVEWVTDLYGRADAAYPGISPTNLVMSATNLGAWQATDELFFNVPSQGTTYAMAPGTAGVSNAPGLGATALASYTYDFTQVGLGLLDASRGDQAYLTQLTTRSAAGANYRALGKVWNLPALTMADGASTSASGAFLDIPQSSTLRLNWKRSALVGMTPQVNPAAQVVATEFGLWASPLGLGQGIPSNAFQLFTYDSGSTSATTDLDLGDLAFGNPFPTAWSLLAETYFTWSVQYLAPGAATPVTQLRSAYTATNVMPTAAAPLTPLLSPVLNPRINGKDLFQNQLAVGSTPTLSWDLPITGTPTGYVVRAYELKNNAGASQLVTRALFRTAARTFTVPPGILLSGSTYVFTISAVRNPGVNYAAYPFRSSFPYASSPLNSAIVAP